jgi:hypothetical protein
VEHREIALGAFLDIERASDSTSSEMIIKAAAENGIGYTIWPWVSSMLGSRNITTTTAQENLEGSVIKGCLQQGLLKPPL